MSRSKKKPLRRSPSRASKPPAVSTPHCDKALAYCKAVDSGKIKVGKLARGACRRHLKDLKAYARSGEFEFDPSKAERVCNFIELLPHVKGKWARATPGDPNGNRIRLEPWQCFIVCSIFGWVFRSTRLRRFTEASVWVPRKNAKSTLVAAIGLWMFAKDGEPGAEVYCGAGSEKQAWEVFGIARQYCLAEPALPKMLGIEVNAKSLIRQTGGSLDKFEPVIGKPGDGASPHCAIIDEYHEHPTSDQYDTFKTGMGAREQPLLFVISTAGLNSAGPAKDHWDEGAKIAQGLIESERHFCIAYTVDDPEDWQTEASLKMANPNWGVSVLPATILPEQEAALREARKQGSFKTKHLNVWVTANTAFFNLENWKKCRSELATLDRLGGRPCTLGGDLSSKVDLVAVAKAVPEPDGFTSVFARYYLPEDRANLPENQHYRKWAAEGWLTLTPGNIVDLAQVRDEILEDCKRFEVREIALDPFQATLMINELREQNAPAIEFRQVVLQMSEPMKALDADIRSGKIRHDGNPITAWCLSNTVGHEDVKGNVYPRKENNALKIDGAVALIMAYARSRFAPVQASAPGMLMVDI